MARCLIEAPWLVNGGHGASLTCIVATHSVRRRSAAVCDSSIHLFVSAVSSSVRGSEAPYDLSAAH
jgi:hypothetical protein